MREMFGCMLAVVVLVCAGLAAAAAGEGEREVKTRGRPPPDGASIVREVVRFKPLRLPRQFAHYDTDGDGLIQLSELAQTTGTSARDAGKPFELADTNEDGVIDIKEFEKAPWRLDGKREKKRRKKVRGKKKKERKDAKE